MRVRTGEKPSQITFDHPDGARPTPRASSTEPPSRSARLSPPDPAAPPTQPELRWLIRDLYRRSEGLVGKGGL